jgi:hypothetical protein
MLERETPAAYALSLSSFIGQCFPLLHFPSDMIDAHPFIPAKSISEEQPN